ncbi:FHA domain-containing protein [Flexivirga caeni]|uniref:FHA domain-containing protein n=1 Tax=Flexivirga caeni TaxID=2294115 RepID=A0A3M9M9N0_9MICO|nr:FHA domain-containing protein [Flexivirga caeni]RNI22280.1 FHA domain-containing protein [Flexivirga caeni]
MTSQLVVTPSPGTQHGIVWPAGMAMIDAAVTAEAAHELWWAVRQNADLGGFLEQLARQSGNNLLQLSPFAVVLASGEGVKCAVRGAFTIRVRLADGQNTELTGVGASTWVERGLGPVSSISIGADGRDPGEGSAQVLLRDAVIRADALSATVWRAQPHTPEPQAVQAEPAPASPVEPPVPAPVDEELVPPRAPSRPVAGGAAGDIGDSLIKQEFAEPEAAPDLHAATTAEAPGAATLTDADDPAPIGPDDNAAEPAGERRFAHLWDATSIQPVESAAVREPVFIDEVPVPQARHGVASPPARPADEWDAEDHDGHTIVQVASPDGLSAPGELRAPPALETAQAETVLAIRCAQQHPNPPQRTQCYLCGAPCGGGAAQAQRPPLGRLRVSTGEVLDLSRPIVVGRSPRAGRAAGPAIPRLLALPFQHVSGTHLEIDFEGWNVLAIDRHSTNGTYLRREGDAPVRLPEAPTLLVDHDVLDLGHGVQLTMEGLP